MKRASLTLIAKTMLTLLCVLAICGCCQQNVPANSVNEDMSWQAQYDIGIKYLAEGKFEDAIIAFALSIEIDPKMADAYLGLAKAYVAQGDIKKGIQTVEQGILFADDTGLLQEYLTELEHLDIKDTDDTIELSAESLPTLTGVGADIHIQDKHTGAIEIHGLNVAEGYTIDTTGMEPMRRLLQWWVKIKSEDGSIAVWTAMWAYEQETSYTQSISEMQSSLSYYCSDGIDYTVADAPVEITQDGMKWPVAVPDSNSNDAAPEADIHFDLYKVTEVELMVYDITQGGWIMDGLVNYSVF